MPINTKMFEKNVFLTEKKRKKRCKSVEKYHNQSKYNYTRKNNPCCQQVKKLTHL